MKRRKEKRREFINIYLEKLRKNTYKVFVKYYKVFFFVLKILVKYIICI